MTVFASEYVLRWVVAVRVPGSALAVAAMLVSQVVWFAGPFMRHTLDMKVADRAGGTTHDRKGIVSAVGILHTATTVAFRAIAVFTGVTSPFRRHTVTDARLNACLASDAIFDRGIGVIAIWIPNAAIAVAGHTITISSIAGPFWRGDRDVDLHRTVNDEARTIRHWCGDECAVFDRHFHQFEIRNGRVQPVAERSGGGVDDHRSVGLEELLG